MGGEVIKSFLVGLGFSVDDAALSKFNKAITSASLKAAALGASITAMATAVGYGISKVAEDFEQMGYDFRIIAPAINKALVLRRELLKAYSAAGINIVKVVRSSVMLNMSLAKTRFAFEAIYKSVASRFFDLLTRQSDMFRQRIYANMPKIQFILERMIQFIFKSLEAITTLGVRLWSILTRVYEFFSILDAKTDGWSTAILGVIAAWKILNLGFLATPLGMLLVGFTSLLALWDDFKTFREGGQSLINWGSDMTKTIIGMAASIGVLSTAIVAIATIYSLWTNATKLQIAAQAALNFVMNLNPIGLVISGVTILIGLITLLDSKWKLFGGNVSGFFSSLGGKIMDFAAGGPMASGGVPPTRPIGTTSNSQTNMSLQQQTNFNISSTASAESVGKHVLSGQNQNNAELARNMGNSVTAK